MFISFFYKMFVKEGLDDGDYIDCFIFVLLALFSLPLEILLSPISIIAFIIYRINKRRKQDGEN